MNIESSIFTEIESIKAKIKEHEQEAQKYRDMLARIIEMASGAPVNTHEREYGPSSGSESIWDYPEVKAGTFEESVVRALLDGVPKSTRQLMEHPIFENRFDNISHFSARMIALRNKRNANVSSVKLDGQPDSYFGLSRWFRGDKLKPEYLERIKKPR